jgi:D-aminopeptidase
MGIGTLPSGRRALAWVAALSLTPAVTLALDAGSHKPRARELGVPFTGQPGQWNAITDVPGVEVGEVTLISGSGKLVRGQGPVRTGVTAILPRGKLAPLDPVFAGWFALNGNGEMTGTAWVEESGQLYGPIMITNTNSVGVVRDAVIAWSLERYHVDLADTWELPVVAETWDAWLSDMDGFHVRREHAFAALDDARSGPVGEGNVGGGTGMICYEFKCGTGTASRRVSDSSGVYTLGVLVQANTGSREELMIAGVPVGRELPEQRAYASRTGPHAGHDAGSVIVVLATDAPLLPHQLKRIARRASMGVARTGTTAHNDSGDLFVAFSTSNSGAGGVTGLPALKMIPNDRMTPFFQAAAEATEEAIVNALVAAETMTGANDRRVIALPHDRLVALLAKYNRLAAH